MCKINGNTDASVPYTRIRLSDFAELQETLNALEDDLTTAERRATAFQVCLTTIANLCPATDEARGYIGNIARAALNPPKPSNPGQEIVSCG